MTKHDAIPRYGLYGEAASQAAADIVHCETIAERSSIYRWEIAPHRHAGLWQILFLNIGTADIVLAESSQAIAGPLIVVAPAGVVHGFRFSELAEGLVLTMAQEFVQQFSAGDPLTEHLAKPLVWRPHEGVRTNLLVLGKQVLQSFSDTLGADRFLLQRALVESWLRIAMAQPSEAALAPRDSRLRDFQALVEQQFRRHRPVADYAMLLGCTERTLARLTNAAWGIPPRQYIQRRIALEARRMLRFTHADCATVAYELGFSDPSYFSRFYLRMTGERPGKERQGSGHSA